MKVFYLIQILVQYIHFIMANKYSIEQLEFIKSEYLEDPIGAT